MRRTTMAVDHAPLDRLERALVAERPHLVGVAYRVTGSRVEAEDIVQEAWLRARRADPATIENPEAWLTTVVSRLALDSLKSARVRREAYVGPYLPEPVPTGGAQAGLAGPPRAGARRGGEVFRPPSPPPAVPRLVPLLGEDVVPLREGGPVGRAPRRPVVG